MTKPLHLDVFGREMQACAESGSWTLFWVGNEGKRRPVTELAVTGPLSKTELIQLLEDFFHEWASPDQPSILLLDK